MNEAALGNFYTMLADASPIPVMIYNMPGNSGVNVPSSLTLKLAAHPNITGIKDSGGNIVQISEVLAKAPEGFSVFAGSGSYLLATLLLGGVGGTLAVANVVPDYCAEIQENFEKGDIEKARKMQLALLPLNAAVTSRFGIGGMKAAMDMVGFKGGLPRLPILPAGEETKKEIARILKELGIPTV
jgi:4-hydroxy-2-oxoglutarate aldolase